MGISHSLRVMPSRMVPMCGAGIVLALAVLLGAGCRQVDEGKRRIIAQNKNWQVVAVGELDAPGTLLSPHSVDFEVVRDSRIYARGFLYGTGTNDPSFTHRFSEVRWLGDGVLHLSTTPHGSSVAPVPVTITNKNREPIKWLTVRIVPNEVFLLLNVLAGQSIQVPSTWGHVALYKVEGSMASGDAIVTSELRIQESSSRVELTVTGSRVVRQ
jgi:hypothetical protein